MSGTSLDGVDGVLCRIGPAGTQVLGHRSVHFDGDLAAECLALNRPGENELHRAALAANRLAELYAEVVRGLLADHELRPSEVRAIGAHGQTVRHRPGEFGGIGYTLQINAPALLAERTGIPVALRDERLTTVEAQRVLRESGVSLEKRKRAVDKLAAVILLEGYLDSLRGVD